MKFKLGNTLGTLKKFGGDLSKWAEEAKKLGSKQNLDDLQLLVDLAGMIPGYGAVADILNAVISLMRGDWSGVLSSLVAAVPIAGDAAKGVKIIKNADKYLMAIGRLERNLINRLPAPVAKKLKEATDALKNKLIASKKASSNPPSSKKTSKDTNSTTTNKTQSNKTQSNKTNPKGQQPKRTKSENRKTRERQENAKRRVSRKEVERRRNQGKASNNQKASGKKQKDSKSQPKKNLKCGDNGTYKDLKKTTGENKYDRDHIPSKASLKKRAVQLNRDRKLTSKQATAIEDAGLAISIPKKAHKEVSPTYGRKNNTSTRITEDAGDLAKAAQRDIDAMEKEIDKYEPGCKKFYQKAARKILAMTNADYDKLLKEILKNPNLK